MIYVLDSLCICGGRLVGHADVVCPGMEIILCGISAYLLLQVLYTELCHCT